MRRLHGVAPSTKESMLSTRPEDTLDEDYDEFAFLEDVAA